MWKMKGFLLTASYHNHLMYLRKSHCGTILWNICEHDLIDEYQRSFFSNTKWGWGKTSEYEGKWATLFKRAYSFIRYLRVAMAFNWLEAKAQTLQIWLFKISAAFFLTPLKYLLQKLILKCPLSVLSLLNMFLYQVFQCFE